MLDLNKPLRVRGAADQLAAVRVLATDLDGRFPVAVAVVELGPIVSYEPVFQFDLNGKPNEGGRAPGNPIYWRLENVPDPEPAASEAFLNVYRYDDHVGVGNVASSLDEAARYRDNAREFRPHLGVVRITAQGDKLTKVELCDAGA